MLLVDYFGKLVLERAGRLHVGIYLNFSQFDCCIFDIGKDAIEIAYFAESWTQFDAISYYLTLLASYFVDLINNVWYVKCKREDVIYIFITW